MKFLVFIYGSEGDAKVILSLVAEYLEQADRYHDMLFDKPAALLGDKRTLIYLPDRVHKKFKFRVSCLLLL